MSTAVQAINIPVELSADAGVTWKTLVCVSDHSDPLTAPTTKTNTQCGSFTGVGLPEFNPTGNAVCDIAGTVGTVSMQQMKQWLVAITPLKYRIRNPQTGSISASTIYTSGDCFVSSVTETFTVGDVVKFAWALAGQGLPIVTPPTNQ